MRRFGLVGYPLEHSYSRDFFYKKFDRLGLENHVYQLFEMEFLKEFPALWVKYLDLIGVNVTAPHKENVIQFLDRQDSSVLKVGAANVIMRRQGQLVGYNTDCPSFKESLAYWIDSHQGEALILGSGGTSKAVEVALKELKIHVHIVSRRKTKGNCTYQQLLAHPELIHRFKLIINTTPLGMSPQTKTCPDIPYAHLTDQHYLFDVIYNPQETLFMKRGRQQGAQVKNGLEMLKLQAEKAWNIWNS